MGNNGSGGADRGSTAEHQRDVHLDVAAVPPTFSDGTECFGSYAGDAAGETGWSTFDAEAERDVQLAGKGLAASAPTTLIHFFKEVVRRKGGLPALRVERPTPPFVKGQPPSEEQGVQWKEWTWQEYYDATRLAARAFIAAGLKPHEAVAIYGFNAPEWIIGEMAAILAGGAAAGVYPTDTQAQVKYKSEHSNAVVACVDTVAKAKMFLSLGLPKLRLILVWGGADCSEVAKEAEGSPTTVLGWDQLTTAPLASDEELDARMDAQKPGHCCAYIYTSGTTGQPKAVMISHDNICYITQSCLVTLPFLGASAQAPQERVISYLPLSHVAGMMVDVVLPIVTGALRTGHFTVTFARNYDLKEGTLVDRLRAVQPTLFLGVPRVWEKIQEKMVATVRQNPPTGMKKRVADWAKSAGLQHQRNCQLGGTGKKSALHGFYDSKVYSVVRGRLGLNQCKFAFTGAAPISVDTLEFFGQLGVNINEVYGMSESTGATTWSTDKAHQWGSCGWALPGLQVKCLREKGPGEYVEAPQAADIRNPKEEEQGELCFRGRHIMMGYMANPDLGEAHVEEIAKKNREAIDKDGWMHSGDKGCIGRNGLVRITGRFKELIIGAGGENVAPVPIENAVKKLQPAVSNIMMVGDKRKFNVALVTLKTVGATGDLPGGDDLSPESAALVSGVTTVSGAMQNKEFTDKIWAAIAAANGDGSVCPSNASKIQKFTILPADFSVQTSELTPTLKLKRSHVEGQHAELINRMYDSADKYYCSQQ